MNQSCLVNKKFTSKASSSGFMRDPRIERLESRLEKMRLENIENEEADQTKKMSKKPEKDDNGLELKLAYGDFPIISQHQEGTKSEEVYNRYDGLDLGLATLLPPMIHYEEYEFNTSSLIHAIGCENSIKSLVHCPRYKYASIASVNQSFRELIESGEIYRARSMNHITEHWVYFACHLLKWEAFDPVSKKWVHLPIIKADKCFEYSDKESMGVGTELLVLEKDVFGQAIKKYSLLTNSWSLAKPMNTPRCLFGSASLGKIAIFAGGVNESGKIVDTVESYNSETGAWETLPRLLKPRKMSSGVFLDGKFYVIGGSGGNDTQSFSCGEEYDLKNNKWKEIPNMSPVGSGGSMSPPLLAVAENELYAADCLTMKVKKYDKLMKVWVSIGWLPKRADNMAGWGIAFRGCGDRVIIVGGPRTHGNACVELYSWVPSEGPPQWSMIVRKKSDNFVYNCAICWWVRFLCVTG